MSQEVSYAVMHDIISHFSVECTTDGSMIVLFCNLTRACYGSTRTVLLRMFRVTFNGSILSRINGLLEVLLLSYFAAFKWGFKRV